MKKASIDIGSNSILLLVVDDDFQILANESRVTGLGRYLDETGSFSEQAMLESEKVLAEYAQICESLELRREEVIVTATEASRVAKNAHSFYQAIEKRYGLKVNIITGEAEAYFATQGVLFDKGITADEITIMDIGGASTELIRVNTSEGRIIRSFSMPIGVIRMNNWELDGCRVPEMKRTLGDYKSDIELVNDTKIYCVAGTMTSVGNMALNNREYREQDVHGFEMPADDIETLLESYQGHAPADILERFPFLGKRSGSIISGLLLAKELLRELNCKMIYISTYGVRYGTLLKGEVSDGDLFKG